MSARWSEQELEDYKLRRNRTVVAKVDTGAEAATRSQTFAPAQRYFIIPGPPVAKPRQTRRDQWLDPPRPCVARYRKWADRARECAGELPTKPGHLDVKFYLPMPPSWTTKRRDAHRGQPHQVKPDKDNLEKAVADALLKNDQCIWKGRQEKRWDDGQGPRVEITIY